MAQDQPLKLSDILCQIKQLDSGDSVSLGDVVGQFAGRGFGPILLAPALIALLPTGAIPGVPTACGIVICLVAAQMLFGRESPWLPSWLKMREITRSKVESTTERLLPVTRRIDRLIHPRLQWLSQSPWNKGVAFCCALVGLSMIPLEVVPMAAGLPAGAIVIASVGLSARDGVFTLAGLLLILLSVGLALLSV